MSSAWFKTCCIEVRRVNTILVFRISTQFDIWLASQMLSNTISDQNPILTKSVNVCPKMPIFHSKGKLYHHFENQHAFLHIKPPPPKKKKKKKRRKKLYWRNPTYPTIFFYCTIVQLSQEIIRNIHKANLKGKNLWSIFNLSSMCFYFCM